MSENVLVALIASVPGTITAVVALLEVAERRREREWTRKHGDRPEPPQPTPHHTGPLPRRGSPLRLPTIVLGGLLLTVAVGLVAALTLDGGDDRNGGGEDTVVVNATVPGTSRWADTNVKLETGDQVTIIATGEVFHSVEQQRKAGPNGELGVRFPSNVLMSADHGALIGRIGDDGEPFFVGDERQLRAASSGKLFLRVNDTGVENNSGAFQAEITVSRTTAWSRSSLAS